MKSEEHNGRKIDSEYDNPIDDLIIEFVDRLTPFFKSMNYTANGITTLSLIFGVAALYHMMRKELVPFTVYATLYYVFDVMDGHYARKYNITSKWGDKYDHFKDLLIGVGGVYILFTGYDIAEYPVLILCILTLMILASLHVGCQEQMRNKEDRSDTLSIFNCLSKETCKRNIGVLRWFGTGSVLVASIALVWYLHSQSEEEEIQMLDLSGNYNNYSRHNIVSYYDMM